VIPELTLDHIVIAVDDLDAATEDYTALLGRRPSWRGEHPAYGTNNTLFRIDNTYVELLALGPNKGKDKRWAGELSRFLDQRGEGLYALALGTSDIKDSARAARHAGLEVLDPANGDGIDVISGARREWRNAMVATKSTNGTRLFFIEHKTKPDALPAAELVVSDGSCVVRMDHAVVLSADMEASRRVWDHALGARLALDRTFPERNTRILFFRLGDITIEISGGATQSKEGIGKPDRLWGVAWGVDNVDAACARLNAAGIETSGPRSGIKPGTRLATAKGPRTHGVATLLIEHTPESFRPESRVAHGAAFDNAPEQRAFTAKALDHIVISTRTLDATWPKWSDALGMTPSEVRSPEGAPMRIARLPATNAYIELAQPTSGEHPIAQAIEERGQGMHAIAIEVDNLDAAVADLRAKGVLVSDIESDMVAGTRVARVNKHAANGVSVELIQRG
jgi:methylmalonyl-CoA epimerase